jgi:hypothetical protein
MPLSFLAVELISVEVVIISSILIRERELNENG